MTDQFTVDGIFHARLTSKRESKSGIFLTIQLTPDDFSPDLAQLRAGSLLKMGWQEMVDVSVQPIEIPSQRGTTLDQAFVEPVAKSGNRGDSRERPAHPKERFEAKPLVTQCVLRCGDEEFMNFFDARYHRHVDESLADAVRGLCGVASRADIRPGTVAATRWLKLEAEYQSYLTDQRHAGSRR